MSIAFKDVLDAARKLTPEEREELLDLLIAEQDGQPPISQEEWDAAWGEEAERRWKEHVASVHPGYPAEEVLAEGHRRLEAMRKRG